MDSLKPKKQLGQHFLADENTARKIVDALQAPPEARIVEIGPGMGVLTKYLVERYKDVHVVEYDPDAVAYLKAHFADSQLTIHHADILKWDFEAHLDRPTWFIGNLPYNISSPIFFRLLEYRHLVQRCVFMVQKEVADRVCAAEEAPPKQKGILSVLTHPYFERKYLFKVRPSVFRPPPKVMSAVFSFARKPEPAEIHFPAYKQTIKKAFGQRRKTLRNALKSLNPTWESLDPKWSQLRAEALPYAAFAEISNQIAPENDDQ